MKQCNQRNWSNLRQPSERYIPIVPLYNVISLCNNATHNSELIANDKKDLRNIHLLTEIKRSKNVFIMIDSKPDVLLERDIDYHTSTQRLLRLHQQNVITHTVCDMTDTILAMLLIHHAY